MKTELSHLPGGKRRELEVVVQILLEEFGKVVATARRRVWRTVRC